MIQELKPCPFCGGEEKHDKTCIVYIVESHTNFEWLYRDYPDFDYEKAWNQRAERTCHDTSRHGGDSFECSECRATLACDDGYGNTMEFPGVTEYPTRPHYCPNCGARVVE